MKACDVARYMLAKSASFGDLVTNKKLQKLLYYSKAWGLVYFSADGGLVDEAFEAHVHGPVCPEVYSLYKKFLIAPIRDDFDGMSPEDYLEKFRKDHSSDADKLELLDVVYEKYSPFTSMELELLSHKEKPWIEARRGLSPIENGHSIISEDLMKEYYTSKIGC